MDNVQLARMLNETADLMEIAGEDSFRIRSYRNAAAAVEGWPERVMEILQNSERKVTDIPGIGKGIGGVIAEIALRGSFDRRDELLQKYPPTALEMLKIQGLGPKSIALIIEHFRVTTVDGLEQLAREQKLRGLPRMGAKLEEKVLRSIAQYRKSTGRFLLNFASEIADNLGADLEQVPGVAQVTPGREPFEEARKTVRRSPIWLGTGAQTPRLRLRCLPGNIPKRGAGFLPRR